LNKTLIVGFGSPNGDDRFGWLVIAQLQAVLDGGDAIKAICCDRSGIDWIHQYQPVEQLIFVDAVKSGAAPGTAHYLTLTPSEFDNLPPSYSSHGIGLQQGLAIATEVIALPEEIEFHGIELGQCSATAELSESITEKIITVAREILKKVRY